RDRGQWTSILNKSPIINQPSAQSSPFAELEALARSGHSVLLALLGARVAREQPFGLQRLAQLGVVFDQRARDAESHGAGLTRHAAAVHRRQDVELVAVSVTTSGVLICVRSASVVKNVSNGRWLMVTAPVPGRRNTRAVDVLRRPVP